MPVAARAARHVAAGPGHQFAGLAGAAMGTVGDIVPVHQFLEFFLTGSALVFVDRHFFLQKQQSRGADQAPPGQSAFRRGIAVQVGQYGHNILEQKMFHKGTDKVAGGDVDFLDQRGGRVGDMQHDVA